MPSGLMHPYGRCWLDDSGDRLGVRMRNGMVGRMGCTLVDRVELDGDGMRGIADMPISDR